MLNPQCTVAENLINNKGKGGGIHNTATTAAMDVVTGGTQADVAAVDINSIIPSESNQCAAPNPISEWLMDSGLNSSFLPVSTELVSLEAGRMQPEMVTDKEIEVGKQLEEAFGHLQDLLVSSPLHCELYESGRGTQEPSTSTQHPTHHKDSPPPTSEGMNYNPAPPPPLTMPTNIPNQPIEHHQSVADEIENDNTVGQSQEPIDIFLNSITRPLPQPLLAPRPQQTIVQEAHTPQSMNKHQSTRLAQKALANAGKGTIEIAQELLVRKLGDLAGTASDANNNTADAASDANNNTADADFYMQHVARPVEKKTMEAIQVLIEHGAKVQEKNGAPRTDGETPGWAV
jgi:hypothetical protein